MTDAETDAQYLEALLALTRALREAKGPMWTQQKMADHIGTSLSKYKKYERRSPMPHRLLTRFCETVGVTADEFLSLKARALRAVPKGTMRKQK
jgi:transcriptional regulator with XRE-family HTH domain